MRRTDIPQFGPLQGVKVVHSSISIAGPFCAQLMADMGADVIWIENPKAREAAASIRAGRSSSTAAICALWRSISPRKRAAKFF